MKVSEAMSRDVRVAAPEHTLQQVAQAMAELDAGAMPVGENDRLVGMITDRDITVRATAECCEPEETFVSDVMTEGIEFCFDDQDVAEAADLMEQKQIRRLAILDHNKRLVGILSLGDLAVKTANDRLSGEALERVSQPARPIR